MSTSLAEHTTMRVGGIADDWLCAESAGELVDAIRGFDVAGTPVLLLGDGSNLVVADSGFRGTVLEISSRGLAVVDEGASVRASAAAGEPWDEFVAQCVDSGWQGVEALSGVPGRVGATPVQNVGAYGQEVAQAIVGVEAFDRRTGEVVSLGAQDCTFGYRDSAFKRAPGRWLVLSVAFRLVRSGSGVVRYADLARTLGVEVGGTAPLAEIRAGVLALRASKGMVLDVDDHDTWSAGSFFTNPVLADDASIPADCPRYPSIGGTKVSAAWLIERSGIPRGFRLDAGSGAAVSAKHALAITNRGSASAADVMALADHMRERVGASFGIELQIEPTVIGFEPR